MAGKAWARQIELQKKYETEGVPEHDKMVEIIEAIPNPRDAALMAIMYLTAGRVSEIVKAVARKNLSFTTRDGREAMVVRMPNEKNRKRTTKTLPVPIDQDRKLVALIANHAEGMDEETPLFDITRQRAWQITSKFGFNPHIIRHIRLTHLEVMYGFGEALLIRFAGWTDGRPAQTYLELNMGDFMDKMKSVG